MGGTKRAAHKCGRCPKDTRPKISWVQGVSDMEKAEEPTPGGWNWPKYQKGTYVQARWISFSIYSKYAVIKYVSYSSGLPFQVLASRLILGFSDRFVWSFYWAVSLAVFRYFLNGI